ncbi:MAG: thioredoxin family protein [Candidatus Pacebacteria bacterium]|nr:thioredoxin family protein [Candidatus Paceibacterota bacterium]
MENQKKLNVWMVIAIVFFIAAAVLGGLFFKAQQDLAKNSKFVGKTDSGTLVNPDTAAKDVVDYINNNLDAAKSTTLKDVSPDKYLFYKINLNVGAQPLEAYVTADEKLLFFQGIDISKKEVATDGNFKQVEGATVCTENNKPIVYFFGSESCPHCQWEKPIIDAVVALFGDRISYHKNIDNQTDQDIFAQYSSDGSIPAIVLGCEYYRVGSGEQIGADAEKAALTKLICNLTGNQPGEVCTAQ